MKRPTSIYIIHYSRTRPLSWCKNPQVGSIILASGATVNVRKLMVTVAVLTNPQTTVLCHHLIYREVYPFISVQYVYISYTTYVFFGLKKCQNGMERVVSSLLYYYSYE